MYPGEIAVKPANCFMNNLYYLVPKTIKILFLKQYLRILRKNIHWQGASAKDFKKYVLQRLTERNYVKNGLSFSEKIAFFPKIVI